LRLLGHDGGDEALVRVARVTPGGAEAVLAVPAEEGALD
jgi:hypothetical protein